MTEFLIPNPGVKQQYRVSVRSKNSNGLGPAPEEFTLTSGEEGEENCINSDAYAEPCGMSEMEHFTKKVNGL